MAKRKIIGIRVPAPELGEMIWKFKFSHLGREYQFSIMREHLDWLPSGNFVPNPSAHIIYPQILTPEKPPPQIEISAELLRAIKKKIRDRP